MTDFCIWTTSASRWLEVMLEGWKMSEGSVGGVGYLGFSGVGRMRGGKGEVGYGSEVGGERGEAFSYYNNRMGKINEQRHCSVSY